MYNADNLPDINISADVYFDTFLESKIDNTNQIENLIKDMRYYHIYVNNFFISNVVRSWYANDWMMNVNIEMRINNKAFTSKITGRKVSNLITENDVRSCFLPLLVLFFTSSKIVPYYAENVIINGKKDLVQDNYIFDDESKDITKKDIAYLFDKLRDDAFLSKLYGLKNSSCNVWEPAVREFIAENSIHEDNKFVNDENSHRSMNRVVFTV